MNKRQTDLRNEDLHGHIGEGLTPAGLPVQSAITGGARWRCCNNFDVNKCFESNQENEPSRLGYMCFRT